jgi:hypothetical protein
MADKGEHGRRADPVLFDHPRPGGRVLPGERSDGLQDSLAEWLRGRCGAGVISQSATLPSAAGEARQVWFRLDIVLDTLAIREPLCTLTLGT